MRTPAIFHEDHPLYPILISFNVILTTFLSVCSAVATMIADSAIQGELALSDTESIWLTTLYLLGLNTMVPCSNWFAHHYGIKRIYTYGVLIFTIASLFAGLSQGFISIALARFVEGIGAGFIFPVGLSLIVESIPKNRLSTGINIYVGIVFGGGLGIGIPLAGYLTQFHSWREFFYLIVPFGLLAAFSCWLSRQLHPQVDRKPFDVFGFLSFALFISTLLIALTLGPIRSTDQGWRTPYIVLFFIIAAISLIVCIWIEKEHPNPLFPVAVFKDPVFSVSLAAMFLLGMATFASVSVSIQYMLNALLYEKYTTGKIAAIYGIAMGAASVLASNLSKVIPIQILTFSGLAILVFSYFYNNELSWLTGYAQVIPILILRGLGIGLSLGPTTTLALRDIAPEMKSTAATILTFFRQVGGTYGGTLISIFSIRQTIFHAARFGEQANTQLPAYKLTIQNLTDKFPDPALAKAAIVNNILNQAYIQGMNDALVLFGYVTGSVALILVVLLSYRTIKNRRRPFTAG